MHHTGRGGADEQHGEGAGQPKGQGDQGQGGLAFNERKDRLYGLWRVEKSGNALGIK